MPEVSMSSGVRLRMRGGSIIVISRVKIAVINVGRAARVARETRLSYRSGQIKVVKNEFQGGVQDDAIFSSKKES